jgi:uncharacterized protein with von Willebrand factor type A (vWA) domain
MPTIRYTRWDGSQGIRLDAERVFERLGEYLAHTDDVRQALEWMLRQGLDLPGGRVPGLDDLLEELRARLRSRHREVNFDRALDGMRRRLDALLDAERAALDARGGARPALEAKRAFLDRLPAGLGDAIARLRGYDFEDAGAARAFADLLAELDNIRRLEDFQRRHGELFRGSRALDYAEALALLEVLEQMRQLEQELMAADLGAIDLGRLRGLLGEEAARMLESLRQAVLRLHEAGYLLQREGRVALAPKGVRRVGQLALRDIYQGLLRDRPGGHAATQRGAGTPRPDASRAYRHGDPLHLDLVGTLKRSLARRPATPLRLEPQDFQVYEADELTSTSTVLLLDMSWSMSWEGRFAAAKKVAMAMESLIRSRYPRDYFAIVGFFTRAVELKLRDLPEASWNMGEPFTNLQDGLRLGAELLARRRSPNQHMIVITDGQPTAYFQKGRLYCEWPLSFGGISMRAAQETLKEVERVTRMGIVINTFMLDDSPSLRAFVERMTRVNRGRALYTRPDRLGAYLLVDYLSRKRRRV